MDEFLKDASSMNWWIGVVFVGVVINIVSGYIKKGLENNLSKISGYWKGKKDQRAEIERCKISLLRNNSELRILYALRESRYRIRSFFFIVSGYGSLAFADIFGHKFAIGIMAFGAITILVGLSDHRSAMEVKRLVESSIDGFDKLDT
ncbi:hypothetical protein R1U54_000196 [Vibrio fluvialis]|nr:hypothetical protein [Vibrio fluvialis]